MPRLRTVSPNARGWTRRRAGRHFSYRDADGQPLAKEDVERVKSLAIPPAWNDVWICPYPNGHLQAVGTDAAGRRQYLYHPVWRAKRDKLKFNRVLSAGALLPMARERVRVDLAAPGVPLERACATAVRLLDLGYFRIGNMSYTETNESYGLTTLTRSHVRVSGGELMFRFVGKAGIEHEIAVTDDLVLAALNPMRRRRDGDRLLAYQPNGGKDWRDLEASDVNAYLSELFDGEMTAKDFRTWHATVLAAVSLAASDEPGDTKTSRRRAIKAAVEEVSASLGNTPTIAKASYIDPRVLDLYDAGVTIGEAARRSYPDADARQAALESALLAMLADS